MAVREARPVPPCTRPTPQPRALALRIYPYPRSQGRDSFPDLISLLWSPPAYVCIPTLPRLSFSSMSILAWLFCASPTLNVLSCLLRSLGFLSPAPPTLRPLPGSLALPFSLALTLSDFRQSAWASGPSCSPSRLQPHLYLIPISIQPVNGEVALKEGLEAGSGRNG